MSSTGLLLVLLAVLVLVSAVFSACEASFLSLQKVRLRHIVRSGSRSSAVLVQMAEHPERFLPTILVGNNLVNTGAAAIATLVTVQLLGDEGIGVLIATVVTATVLIVVGENIPKTLGSRLAEPLALKFAVPLLWTERLLFPAVYPLQCFNRWLSGRMPPGRTLVTHEEIKVLISLGKETGGLEETASELLLRTLHIHEMRLQDIMVPRADIVAIEEGLTLEQFLEFNSRQYFSRFPVTNGGIDRVAGTLETQDVLRAMAQGALQRGDPVGRIVRPNLFLLETLTLPEALAQMRDTDAQLALVVDEFGVTSGLVTFNQLIRQVVGQIEQGKKDNVVAVTECAVTVRGRMPVLEANERLALTLPSGRYRTVAGFMLDRLGHVAKEGDSVVHSQHRLTVLRARGPRIDEVTIAKL